MKKIDILIGSALCLCIHRVQAQNIFVGLTTGGSAAYVNGFQLVNASPVPESGVVGLLLGGNLACRWNSAVFKTVSGSTLSAISLNFAPDFQRVDLMSVSALFNEGCRKLDSFFRWISQNEE